MAAAGPKLSHWPGLSVAYRVPLSTTNWASMSEPPSVMSASPLAAVSGDVVRSPVSVLTGRCLILPFTDSTRCTLLTFLVVRLDLLSSVGASGSGAPDCLDDEQPPTRAAAIERAARAARIGRRVCIGCIVEGAIDPTAKPEVTAPSHRTAQLISLRRCSPESSR